MTKTIVRTDKAPQPLDDAIPIALPGQVGRDPRQLAMGGDKQTRDEPGQVTDLGNSPRGTIWQNRAQYSMIDALAVAHGETSPEKIGLW